MSAKDTLPNLVVIANPRKARYYRKMAQPVPAEDEESTASDAERDAATEARKKVAGG